MEIRQNFVGVDGDRPSPGIIKNSLFLRCFPEAPRLRKWAKPTGVVFEHILINLTSCRYADQAY